MNYWFIYSLTDGLIVDHYRGNATEWNNIPDGCGVLGAFPVSDPTATDCFYHDHRYAVENGQLVDKSTDDEKLNEAKQLQSNIVLSAYEQSTETTFQSSALGQAYTYLSTATAKTRYDAILARFHNDPTYTSEDIYTIEGGYLAHTASQFTQVWTDGFNNEKALDSKYRSLVSQVQAIQLSSYSNVTDAIADIQKIVWS